MTRLAVAIQRIGDIPEVNPFFLSHLQDIDPQDNLVVTLTSADPGAAKLNQPVVSVFDAPANRSWLPGRLVRTLNTLLHGYHTPLSSVEKRRLVEQMKDLGVRVMLAEEGPVGCLLMPVCKAAGVELFVHFHGYDGAVLGRKWFMRHAYRAMARYATAMLVPSNYFKTTLHKLGLPKHKIEVARIGVDLADIKGSNERSRQSIIAVGRFIEKKAPDKTIHAFAKLAAEFPDIKLEMIGDGPLLNHCKILARDLKISDRITFYSGYAPNEYVLERISMARVFCQHSVVAPNGDTESFGITLIEAMGLGTPVVATRHNGFVETVEEEKTGFLVDEGDIDGMSEAIRRLLTDDDLWSAFSQAGKERVMNHFSRNQNLTRIRQILKLQLGE